MCVYVCEINLRKPFTSNNLESGPAGAKQVYGRVKNPFILILNYLLEMTGNCSQRVEIKNRLTFY